MLLTKTALQEKLTDDFSLVALKGAIILLALGFILIAVLVNNKWVLAGTFAYMALP